MTTTHYIIIAACLAALALCWLWRYIRHGLRVEAAMDDWHHSQRLGWKGVGVLHLIGKRYGPRVQSEVIERVNK